MLHLLHINSTGLAILVASFGAAFTAGWLAGFSDEGRLMMVAGVLTIAVDFAVRFASEDGHWLYPRRGGMLLFLPLWVFGILWTALGFVDVAIAHAGK